MDEPITKQINVVMQQDGWDRWEAAAVYMQTDIPSLFVRAANSVLLDVEAEIAWKNRAKNHG